MVFDNGKVVDKVQGADKKKLEDLVKKLAAQAGASSSGGSGSGSGWRIGELPRGYGDVTDQIEVKGLEILNSDDNVRVLIDDGKPSGLQKGKAAASAEKDWVESDTDEQLMLYMPFQANLKVHTIQVRAIHILTVWRSMLTCLQITSLPPSATEDEDEELPMRPKTIQIYHNSAHALGFGEAEDIPATQTVELASNDWDSTGTATITLRFVKFQNVTSLVLFVVDGDGDGEKVRVDRVRIIGETGEKREMGKLEKIDHDH